MMAMAAAATPRKNNGFMGQLNRGIANTVGGLVDFINPFDNPVWGDIVGGKFQTGSAVTGLTTAIEAIGAEMATRVSLRVS